jgi:hypothetical protein
LKNHESDKKEELESIREQFRAEIEILNRKNRDQEGNMNDKQLEITRITNENILKISDLTGDHASLVD